MDRTEDGGGQYLGVNSFLQGLTRCPLRSKISVNFMFYGFPIYNPSPFLRPH